MLRNVALVALSVLSYAVAQENDTSLTVSAGDVDDATKIGWCRAEQNTCPQLCGFEASNNTCIEETLEYNCTCANGSAPGLQYYQQTLPTLMCQKAFEICNEKNAGNAIGQNKCKTDILSHCDSKKLLDPADLPGQSSGDDDGDSTTTATGSGSSATQTSDKSGSNTVTTSSSTGAAAAPTKVIYYAGNGAAAAALGLFAYLI